MQHLFREDITSYTVVTHRLSDVPYAHLDNAATTPPFASVERGVAEFLASYGSVHRAAGTKSMISTDRYEAARQTIKEFVGAPDGSYVILTGNTTGAMNAAAHFLSYIEGKVAVSEIEHSSSSLPFVKAEGIKALGSAQVPLSEAGECNARIQALGRQHVLQYGVSQELEFDLATIEDLLRKNTIKALVLTAASNATGYRPPIKEIGHLAHRYGAYFIVDACQFIQHHPLDMKALGIDFLAASGHKFYAPYGGGFLIGPQAFLDTFLPYEIGGGNLPYITAEGEFLRYENQQAHDPGTPNAVGAVAMALALEELSHISITTVETYEYALCRKGYQALSRNPRVRVHVPERHLGSVLPFSVEGMDPHRVAKELNDGYGIGVRAGSFCVYGVTRRLLGIDDDSSVAEAVRAGDATAVPGFIRASVGLCTAEADIDRLVGAIDEITKG